MNRSIAFFVALFLTCSAFAQTPSEYVAKYHDDAQRQMKKYGIPASITLAQGILESCLLYTSDAERRRGT